MNSLLIATFLNKTFLKKRNINRLGIFFSNLFYGKNFHSFVELCNQTFKNNCPFNSIKLYLLSIEFYLLWIPSLFFIWIHEEKIYIELPFNESRLPEGENSSLTLWHMAEFFLVLILVYITKGWRDSEVPLYFLGYSIFWNYALW